MPTGIHKGSAIKLEKGLLVKGNPILSNNNVIPQSKLDEAKNIFTEIKNILFSHFSKQKKTRHKKKINNIDAFNISLKRAVYGYSFNDMSVILYDKYGTDIAESTIREQCNNINGDTIHGINHDLIKFCYKLIGREQERSRILCCDGTVCRGHIGLKGSNYAGISTDRYCTFYVSTIFDYDACMPIAYNISNKKDERDDVIILLEYVNKGDILICDRGYPSQNLMKTLNDNEIKYVIRISTQWAYVTYIEEKKLSIN